MDWFDDVTDPRWSDAYWAHRRAKKKEEQIHRDWFGMLAQPTFSEGIKSGAAIALEDELRQQRMEAQRAARVQALGFVPIAPCASGYCKTPAAAPHATICGICVACAEKRNYPKSPVVDATLQPYVGGPPPGQRKTEKQIWKCTVLTCKTPTAGPALSKYGEKYEECVACYDVKVTCYQGAEDIISKKKAAAVKADPPTHFARESVMGGYRWIPGARFGQWR
jgi:hypothetical protein